MKHIDHAPKTPKNTSKNTRRELDYESRGRMFESCRVYHYYQAFKGGIIEVPALSFCLYDPRI